MYNKKEFHKVNDKKVLHKVKKQWIVLSLSMLTLIGAGGAISTQTHASTVNAPQVQEEVTSQSSNRNSSSVARHVTNVAANVHHQLMNNANQHQLLKTMPLSANSTSNNKQITLINLDTAGKSLSNSANLKQNSNSPTKVTNIYSRQNLTIPSDYENAIKHYISRVGDYPDGAFNDVLSNPNNDDSGISNNHTGQFNTGESPVKFTLYNDGLLYLHDGTLPTRKVSVIQNSKSNLKYHPSDGVKIPYYISNDTLFRDAGIPAGEIKAIAFNNVTAPSDSSNLFADMPALGAIDFNGLDTSHVTNMNSIFYNDVLLNQMKHISDVDTSNVTNMSHMFMLDSELKSLDLSHFNTSNVKYMMYMFANTGLRSLDLSHFDFNEIYRYAFTPNNNAFSSGLNSMFQNDKSLQNLNLSSLNNINKSYYDGSQINPPQITTPSTYHDQANSDNIPYNMFAGDNELQKITIGPNNNLIGAWISLASGGASDIDPQTNQPSANAKYPNNWLPTYNWINSATMQTVNFNSDMNIPEGTYYRTTDSNNKDGFNPSDSGLPVDFQFGNQYLGQNNGLHISDNYPSINNGMQQAYIMGMPNGYAIDPRLAMNGSLTFDSSKDIYKVSIDQAGTWGNAHWVLTPNSESTASKNYGGGNLYIYDGTINGQFPGDRSQVHSITFGPNVKLAANANGAFQGLTNLSVFGSGLNTSSTADMSNLFANDANLTHIDFGSDFNTSSVTNMTNMFKGDNDLYQVDLTPDNILNRAGQNWASAFFNQNQDMNARDTTNTIKNGEALNGSFYSVTNPSQISVHYILNGDYAHPIVSAHKISNDNIADEVSRQSDLPNNYYVDPSNTYAVQHNTNGNYVDVNMNQRQLTLKLTDWLTGNPVATIQEPNVQAGNVSDTHINAVLPTGYKLADHGDDSDPVSDAHSNDYVPSIMYDGTNQTYEVPVVHNSDVNYGFWGTARYTLNNNGQMTVSGRPHEVNVYQTQRSSQTHKIKLYVGSDNKYHAVNSDDPQFNNSSYNLNPYVRLARYSDGQYLAFSPDYTNNQGSASDFNSNTEVPYEYVSNGQSAVTKIEVPGKINRFNDFRNENNLNDQIAHNSTLGDSSNGNPLFSKESNIKGIRFINGVISPSDCSSFTPYADYFTPDGSGSYNQSHQNADTRINGYDNNGEWLPNQKNLQYVDASGLDTSKVEDTQGHIILYVDQANGNIVSDNLEHHLSVMTSSGKLKKHIPLIYTLTGENSTRMKGMFSEMPRLRMLNLGGSFSTQGRANASDMFKSDSSLSVLTMGPHVNFGDLQSSSNNVLDYSQFFNNNVDVNGNNSTSVIKNGIHPGTYYKLGAFNKGVIINIPVEAVDNNQRTLAQLGSVSVELGTPGNNLESEVKSRLSSEGYQFLNNKESDTLNNTIVGNVLNGTSGIIYNGYNSSVNNALYIPAKLSGSVQVPIKLIDKNDSANNWSMNSANLFTINNQQQIQLSNNEVQNLQAQGYILDPDNQYGYTLHESDVDNNGGSLSFNKQPITLYVEKSAFNARVQFVSDNGTKINGVVDTHIPVKVDTNADLSKVPTPLGYQADNGQHLNAYPIDNLNPVNIKVSLKPYQIPFQIKCNGSVVNGLSDLRSANQFILNNSNAVSLTNSDRRLIKDNWYQLTANEPTFTLKISDLNSDNNFSDIKKPSLMATQIPVNIPIDYKLTNGTKVGSDNDLSYKWGQTPQIPQYAQSHVPAGYQVTANVTDVTKDKGLNQYFTPDNADVNTRALKRHLVYYVDPVQKTDIIHFTNNANVLKTVRESGNDASDSKYVSNTSFEADQISDTSQPNGYHIVIPKQRFSYNGKSDNVAVKPDVMEIPFKIVASDNHAHILYVGKSTNLATVDTTTNLSLPNNVAQNLYDQGYKFTSGTRFQFSHNDVTDTGKFNGNMAPVLMASAINFKLPITFKDVEDNNHVVNDTSAVNNVTINHRNNVKGSLSVPANYQLASGNGDLTKYTFATDEITANDTLKPLTVYIRPQQTTDVIKFMYSGKPYGTKVVTGPKIGRESAFTVKASLQDYVPNGFKLGADQNDRTLHYYDGNDEVTVTPKQMTASVHYNYSGDSSNPIVTAEQTGNDSATGLNNSHFKIGDNPINLPSYWQLSNPSQIIYYNGLVQNVAVTPKLEKDIIVFKDNHGHQISNPITKVGNDYRTINGTFNVNTLSAPQGYYISSKGAINYDGQRHIVNVKPDSDVTVPFQLVDTQTGNVILPNQTTANKFTVTIPTAVQFNRAIVPKGYQLADTNDYDYTVQPNDIKGHRFDQAPLTFKVTPINYTIPMKLVYANSVDGIQNFNRSTRASVDSGFNLNRYVQANLPKNYIVQPSQNLNTWRLIDNVPASGNQLHTITVKIMPIQQQALVVYKSGDTPVGSAINLGSGNTNILSLPSSRFMIGAHPTALPTGYRVDVPNQIIKYNSQIQDVAVTPIRATANLNYQYNGHDVTSSTSTKQVTGNELVGKTTFDLAGLSIPQGYQLAANNPHDVAYSNSHVTINVTPQQKVDTINYVDAKGKMIYVIHVAGNSSLTGLNNSHFIVGNAPAGLPNGYQVIDANQIINYDGNSHNIMVKPVPQPKPTPEPNSNANQPAQPSSNGSNSSSTNSASSSSSNNNSKSTSASTSSKSKASSSNVEPGSMSSSNSETNSSAIVKPSSSAANSTTVNSSASNNNQSSASTASVTPMPVVPMLNVSMPSSSVTNAGTSASAQSVASSSNVITHSARTNRGYIIYRNMNGNHHDVVKYRGHDYVVHYNSNGKNIIRVKKNGHYKNVVISKDLPTNNVPEAIVRAIDMINFNRPVKHVWSWKNANKALNRIKVGEVISHYGTKLARISVLPHYRYFIVNKKALAHLLINKIGKITDNYARSLKKGLVFHINRIIVVHDKRSNYVRYEFKFNQRNFWITARDDYVKNAYLQPNDIRGRKVQTIRKCCLYTNPKYSKRTLVRSIKPGMKLTVKKVIFLGQKNNYQTRLLLNNGDYITANKDYVRVVK